ncbi:MAG: hypothetical protein ACRDFA_02150 [bacterium]
MERDRLVGIRPGEKQSTISVRSRRPGSPGRQGTQEQRETSEQSWAQTKHAFQDSYQQMIALAQSAEKLDRPLYHLMHESYHFGQIMYLRAMQGLPAIE